MTVQDAQGVEPLSSPVSEQEEVVSIPPETQKQIDEIRESLDSAISDLDVKQNFLIEKINKIPKIVKIILSGAVMAGGIITLNPWIICLGAALSGGFFVLDERSKNIKINQDLVEKIRTMSRHIVDNCVFLATESEKLKENVSKFEKENQNLKEQSDKLAKTSKDLEDEVTKLTDAGVKLEESLKEQKELVSKLEKVEKNLKKSIGDLEKEVNKLENQTEKQAEAIQQLQALKKEHASLVMQQEAATEDLINVEAKYQATLNKLQSTTQKLETTQEAFSKTSGALADNQEKLQKSVTEVQRLEAVNQMLIGTVDSFSAMLLADKKVKDVFNEKMKCFLEDKEKSFDKLTARFSDAEKELEITKNQLNERNKEYETLLSKHEGLIASQGDLVGRLEQVIHKKTKEQGTATDSSITRFGMFNGYDEAGAATTSSPAPQPN